MDEMIYIIDWLKVYHSAKDGLILSGISILTGGIVGLTIQKLFKIMLGRT